MIMRGWEACPGSVDDVYVFDKILEMEYNSEDVANLRRLKGKLQLIDRQDN